MIEHGWEGWSVIGNAQKWFRSMEGEPVTISGDGESWTAMENDEELLTMMDGHGRAWRVIGNNKELWRVIDNDGE
eukprot:8274218-Karenia_brevis.AAC.1